MILSTMNDLPGHQVTEVLGDVFGLTVVVRAPASQIEAGLRTFFGGGEARGLAGQLHEGRLEARRRLREAAGELGADAVLAMRFETSELREGGLEICAYGTAVRARRIEEP
ncbi:Uncharacterized conserved protein YbjQ, UPF0145 family [Thermomonospora echinospora]|uniref:UPF0145 protein SAMN04489712_10153 n=1 Tax=Thermomonospora echinospora TaxID=1992 RepID=A0A1H5S2E9_9ACTN|nr:heavy metal-binding domain-containing protein [Thermomonospora echinospora]SEF44765.1 Uncharacterized conserved protein YbjQ, UPF0145 family [Thermomonospora echinospora]